MPCGGRGRHTASPGQAEAYTPTAGRRGLRITRPSLPLRLSFSSSPCPKNRDPRRSRTENLPSGCVRVGGWSVPCISPGSCANSAFHPLAAPCERGCSFHLLRFPWGCRRGAGGGVLGGSEEGLEASGWGEAPWGGIWTWRFPTCPKAPAGDQAWPGPAGTASAPPGLRHQPLVGTRVLFSPAGLAPRAPPLGAGGRGGSGRGQPESQSTERPRLCRMHRLPSRGRQAR